MKSRTAAFVILATLTLAPVSVDAQNDFADVKITAQHLRGSVYMLTGSGGNLGATIGEDGIVLIDDQFAPLAEKIRAALDSLGGGELRFVLNTHWHGDHVGGNPEFGKEATIIAHENVRERLITDQVSLGRDVPAQPKEGWPVITFNKSLSVHFNGEELKVLHYAAGHTDGDAVIYFSESNVVHVGDHMFNGIFPYVDLDHGGNVQSYRDNVAAILELIDDETIIIPGHGPLANKSDLRNFLSMLDGTIAHVRAAKSGGASLEEAKNAGLPEKWKSWDWSFIPTAKWIETIYTSD